MSVHLQTTVSSRARKFAMGENEHTEGESGGSCTEEFKMSAKLTDPRLSG